MEPYIWDTHNIIYSRDIGAIIGGIVGVLVVLGVMVTILLCFRRRKHEQEIATFLRPTGFVIPPALANSPSTSNLSTVRNKTTPDNRPPTIPSPPVPSVAPSSSTTSPQPIRGPSSATTNVQGNTLNTQLTDEQMSLVAGLSGANVLVTDVAGLMGLMRGGRAAIGQGAGSGDMDTDTAPPSYDRIGS
jgi:hypothetical protein